jgi:hypothetical protein
MCGPTSADQYRVIEKDRSSEEETMLMTPLLEQESFATAEVDYRRAQATRQFSRRGKGRIRVPRRPALHLPRPRRRPLSLA